MYRLEHSFPNVTLGHMQTEHTPLPFIRELLAHKSEKEIVEAEERFLALIDLAERVVARQKEEEENAP